MERNRQLLAALCAAALAAGVPGASMADGAAEQPRYSIKHDDTETGTRILRERIAGGTVPFDKRYAELTAEQKEQVRSLYEAMAPADEPPFPIDGLGPLFKAIGTAHDRVGVAGELNMVVEVDSQGNGVSVGVLRSPDARLTRMVATLLMLQKYKPAVCAGQPCAMQFPVRLKLTVRR